MSKYAPTLNLPFTGKRDWKYRVVSVPNDAKGVEETMNRLAGHGYRVIAQTTKGDSVRITFERETRIPGSGAVRPAADAR